MKVLIVAFHSRSMTPYSKQYEDVINELNIKYDIVFWDRFTNGKLEKNKNEYIIHKKCSLGGGKIKKIFPMIYFRNTVKKIINNNKYDRIIVLNTLPAVLLKKTLIKNFFNNYILDIRDYTYEKYNFYKKIVDDLVENSFYTNISSKGFLVFLKENSKIHIGHNISNNDEMYYSDNIQKKKKINIGFVGVVRYEKENQYLLNAIKNDDRFECIYVGRSYPDCNLEQYCINENIENVSFEGEFNNKDKKNIYKNIDVINAIYGNNSLEVQTALPNKLYDAIIFKKPMIVSKKTYLAKIVEKYKLGIAVDLGEDIKLKLEEYINSFDSNSFDENANRLLKIVNEDQMKIEIKIKEFLRTYRNR